MLNNSIFYFLQNVLCLSQNKFQFSSHIYIGKEEESADSRSDFILSSVILSNIVHESS